MNEVGNGIFEKGGILYDYDCKRKIYNPLKEYPKVGVCEDFRINGTVSIVCVCGKHEWAIREIGGRTLAVCTGCNNTIIIKEKEILNDFQEEELGYCKNK